MTPLKTLISPQWCECCSTSLSGWGRLTSFLPRIHVHFFCICSEKSSLKVVDSISLPNGRGTLAGIAMRVIYVVAFPNQSLWQCWLWRGFLDGILWWHCQSFAGQSRNRSHHCQFLQWRRCNLCQKCFWWCPVVCPCRFWWAWICKQNKFFFLVMNDKDTTWFESGLVLAKSVANQQIHSVFTTKGGFE